MSSLPPRHPGQLARQEGETDRKTGKRDGILRRWNYDDLSPGSPPPTPGQPRTRSDPSEESGPSPHLACVDPSVSAPVPCRPHGLHLLPHTSALVASMPSTSWSPLHAQASLFNFGKKYPRPLGFHVSAGQPQDPCHCLLWSLSGLCCVQLAVPPYVHPSDADFLKQPSFVLSCPPGWLRGTPRA